MPQGLPPRREGIAIHAVLLLILLVAPTGADGQDALLKRGEYVYRVANCEGCHTDTEAKGARLAGGPALTTPFGIFYAPNITPHSEHGIGKWSDADFMHALRAGVSPAGTHYYPAFPYTSYTRLTDADLRALKAYIFSLPPVAQPNRPHELIWYTRFRPLLFLWKARYFDSGAFVPDAAKSAQWNRGAYLAEAAAHCAECHSPRDRFGGVIPALRYAGTRDGPEGAVVPNITRDRKTGIGRWSKRDIAYYLETGATPEGDYAGDVMAEVIDHSLRYLTQADRAAIAEYVHGLPAVQHAVRKPKKKTDDEFGF